MTIGERDRRQAGRPAEERDGELVALRDACLQVLAFYDDRDETNHPIARELRDTVDGLERRLGGGTHVG